MEVTELESLKCQQIYPPAQKLLIVVNSDDTTDEKGEVTIKVVDENGDPIEGATVETEREDEDNAE